jgi:hypothetical protein
MNEASSPPSLLAKLCWTRSNRRSKRQLDKPAETVTIATYSTIESIIRPFLGEVLFGCQPFEKRAQVRSKSNIKTHKIF